MTPRPPFPRSLHVVPAALGLLLLTPTPGGTAPPELRRADVAHADVARAEAAHADDVRIDLGAASFTRNGVASDAASRGAPGTPAEGSVRLPCSERGVRWAVEYSTAEAFSARLALHWDGAPDGLLYEVVLDGQRLSPARDAWRPSPRTLTSDLGAAWIGAGTHLLEFVACEAAADAGLQLRALVLERL